MNFLMLKNLSFFSPNPGCIPSGCVFSFFLEQMTWTKPVAIDSTKLASYHLNCGPEGLDQGALLGGGCGVLQQQSAAPGMADVVVHKRQAVIDRLKRRMEGYRRHNQDCVPRYSNAFAEQQNVQETLMLKQKYMETKSKRSVKKNDKKPMENGNGAAMPPVCTL